MGGKGSKAESLVARERYAAQQRVNEAEAAARDKLAEQEREARDRQEELYREKVASEARAHQEKLQLEREKMDLLRESSEMQLRTIMEGNARLREAEREADAQRRELENKSRLAEQHLREENEQKRELERAEAKAREEQKHKEATALINEANKSVLKMKDDAHAEVTRLVEENQRNKDELVKENLKIMEAKDAANAEKLDKLTSTYQCQMRETQELAQQREDALNLERKAIDEKYRRDLENAAKMSKEERDKMTSDHRKMIEDKDRELSKNQQEKAAKIDELSKNHLADLRKAHDDYSELQEKSKAEVERLHREKEEVLRESAARERKMAERMIEMKEEDHKKLVAATHQTAYIMALKSKEQFEVLRNFKCNEELAPIKAIKSAVVDNAVQSCELWVELEDSIGQEETFGEIRQQIVQKAQEMKKSITEMTMMLDNCRSLGEEKKVWRTSLLKIERSHADPYARAVRIAARDENATVDTLHELEQACVKLKEAIQDLEMEVESPEAVTYRNAQATISFVEKSGAAKVITAAIEATKMEIEDAGNEAVQPVVDEQ